MMYHKSRYHILLIEDNKFDQIAFQQMMEQDQVPYDYITASTIAESKIQLSKHKFDLVITDHYLGDGTAFDILEYIIALDIPVIFVTGTGDEEIAVRALKNGVYEYLIKDVKERHYLKHLPMVIQRAVEHKKSEQSVKFYSHALKYINDSIYITDEVNNIIFINETFTENYGYNPDEIIGKSSYILDQEEHDSLNSNLSMTKDIVHYETKHIHKDGTVIPVSISRSLIQAEIGDHFNVVNISRNISNQLEIVEQALRDSEAALKAQYQNIPMPTYTWKFQDDDFILVDYNDAARKYIGDLLENFRGIRCEVLYKDNPSIKDDIYHCYQNRNSFAKEISYYYLSKEEERILSVKYAYAPPNMVIVHTEDITERKKGEDEILLSESENRALLNALPDLMFQISLDGVFEKYHAPYSEDLAVPPEMFLGKNIKDVFPPEFADLVLNDVKKSVKENKILLLEYQMPDSNGQIKEYEARFSPVTKDKVIILVRDITDRKNAELELRTNEQRLKDTLKMGKMGYWEHDIKNNTTLWSDETYAIYGLDKNDFDPNKENYIKFIPADDQPKLNTFMQHVFQSHTEKNSIDHRITLQDGTNIWVYVEIKVQLDENNTPIKLTGIIQDITERKNAEEQLKESHLQFNNLLGSIQHAVWSADLQGNILYMNPGMETIYGRPVQEFINNPNLWLEVVHPEDMTLGQESLQKMMSEGYVSTEYRILRPDGDIRWIRDSKKIILDENGQMIQLGGTAIDITEKKRYEEELIKSKEIAEKASQAKSDFLSSMSHELRTPMNAILGFAQILEMETQDESHKNFVNEIYKAGKHLLELIDDVLDLSLIESNKVKLSPESTNLKRLILDVIDLIQSSAQKNNIKIINNLPPDKEYSVFVDYTRFKQVMLNILSNAVKYNVDGGKVTISIEYIERSITILIADTGKGIRDEQKAHLFQPFDRAGMENSSIEGTGIGLVITKRLLEMMKGKIGYSSELNKGTTFWVEIPGKISDHDEEIKQYKILEEISLPTGKNDKSILYIEDNPSNLRLVAQIIESKTKYHLINAPNGSLGLELAKEHTPDLILLDINLPEMDGFEVLKILQEMKETKDTPVIAVSARAMARDIARGKSAGFIDYISKPIEIINFLTTIHRYLDNDNQKNHSQ